jgi:hypothetical protein
LLGDATTKRPEDGQIENLLLFWITSHVIAQLAVRDNPDWIIRSTLKWDVIRGRIQVRIGGWPWRRYRGPARWLLCGLSALWALLVALGWVSVVAILLLAVEELHLLDHKLDLGAFLAALLVFPLVKLGAGLEVDRIALVDVFAEQFSSSRIRFKVEESDLFPLLA